MKNGLFFFLIVLFVSSCANRSNSSKTETAGRNDGIPKIVADAQTQPVDNSEDAADDPCIWYNERDPGESRIIGTNKKSGLSVYNLQGKELHHYPVGRVNNVDIRYQFQLGNESIAIVGATNRSFNSISLFKVVGMGEFEVLTVDEIISDTEEVYGFCFYQSGVSGLLYGILVSKSGTIEQYQIDGEQGTVSASLVRTIALNSQCEGLVADDELGNLFVGEENHGIWKFNAEPSGKEEGELVADLSNTRLSPDIEGLTLYLASGQKGYLIASSQGNNTYALFDRSGNNSYIGSFSVESGEVIDGTSETDGIDVINLSLGPVFPDGFFVVQDGNNETNGKPDNQNFKIISWSRIAQAFEPPLLIDRTFDFR